MRGQFARACAMFYSECAVHESRRRYPVNSLVCPSHFRPIPLAANHQVSDFFEGVDILKNIGVKTRTKVRFSMCCSVAHISHICVKTITGADVCVATGAAVQASYIVSADSDKVQVSLPCVLCGSVCKREIASARKWQRNRD